MSLNRSLYRKTLKPAIDRIIAAVLLVLCAPLLAMIAVAVLTRLGSPILFSQLRPGRNGRPFRIYKFRTMRTARDADGRLLADAARLTPFGRWLRTTSLDELPELWNVLRGDMSLVGPRPLLTEYLDRYSPRQARRHEVRPGITGWAQVNGRNSVDWESKFELDTWYVDHCNLWLDLYILVATIGQVVRRRGITMHGHATVERFGARTAIVLGAGGHAKVAISTLRAAGWQVAALYDDDTKRHGTTTLGVAVRGAIADIPPSDCSNAVVAVGDATHRRAIASTSSLNFITVIHPAAWVDPSAEIGAGAIVCAGAVIQPNARVGAHVIVNTSATIDHDCEVGDVAHIGPGAHLTGNVRVGAHSLLGAGSTIVPGVNIGRNTVVGAGATVVCDLPDHVVAVGCPARIINRPAAATDAA